MSPYVCDCTNVVYMLCVYCIYYYVNKFEARSLFSTSHLKKKSSKYEAKDINKTLDSHDTSNQNLKRDKRPLTLHKNHSQNLEN